MADSTACPSVPLLQEHRTRVRTSSKFQPLRRRLSHSSRLHSTLASNNHLKITSRIRTSPSCQDSRQSSRICSASLTCRCNSRLRLLNRTCHQYSSYMLRKDRQRDSSTLDREVTTFKPRHQWFRTISVPSTNRLPR